MQTYVEPFRYKRLAKVLLAELDGSGNPIVDKLPIKGPTNFIKLPGKRFDHIDADEPPSYEALV